MFKKNTTTKERKQYTPTQNRMRKQKHERKKAECRLEKPIQNSGKACNKTECIYIYVRFEFVKPD